MCGNADESTQTVKGLAQQVSKFLRLARATVWDAACFAILSDLGRFEVFHLIKCLDQSCKLGLVECLDLIPVLVNLIGDELLEGCLDHLSVICAECEGIRIECVRMCVHAVNAR